MKPIMEAKSLQTEEYYFVKQKCIYYIFKG